MYRESHGKIDINVSHNLSKRLSVKSDDRIWNNFNDQHTTSKIEMRYNNIKGVR